APRRSSTRCRARRRAASKTSAPRRNRAASPRATGSTLLFGGNAAPQRIVEIDEHELDHVRLADRAVHRDELGPGVMHILAGHQRVIARHLVERFEPALILFPIGIAQARAMRD